MTNWTATQETCNKLRAAEAELEAMLADVRARLASEEAQNGAMNWASHGSAAAAVERLAEVRPFLAAH